ncbi:MAG TPA: hypothetical protein VII63_06135 [Caulobacteraceae bacterium]
MKQIDLDDLPPKLAQILAGLREGEALDLVQHGALLARLTVQASAPQEPGEILSELPPEERMNEVLSQFNAMIHDEF